MSSDTPRTDAEPPLVTYCDEGEQESFQYVRRDFARELEREAGGNYQKFVEWNDRAVKAERELAAALGERDALLIENRGLSKDNGTLALTCGKLHAERDQLCAELARAKEDVARLDAIIAVSSTWTSREAIDEWLRKIKEGLL